MNVTKCTRRNYLPEDRVHRFRDAGRRRRRQRFRCSEDVVLPRLIAALVDDGGIVPIRRRVAAGGGDGRPKVRNEGAKRTITSREREREKKTAVKSRVACRA
jgi:hypothetical protein